MNKTLLLISAVLAGLAAVAATDTDSDGLSDAQEQHCSFEQAAFPPSWNSDGSVPWAPTGGSAYEGSAAARAGAIGHGQFSRLQLSVTTGVGEIEFFYRVASEEYADFLKFSIDGELKAVWSGSIGWTAARFAIEGGPHLLIWEYAKDADTSAPGDSAWIDWISVPGAALFSRPDAVDTDGDGSSDSDEYVVGSDPRIPGPPFSFLSLVRNPTNLTVQWPSAPWRQYDLFVCTNLTGGVYTCVASNLPGLPPTNAYFLTPPAARVVGLRLHVRK